MSPFRWDVLAVAFMLAVPLLALGLRGDLTSTEVMTRLPWCLAAGYGAVAILRWASRPRGELAAAPEEPATAPAAETEPTPAA